MNVMKALEPPEVRAAGFSRSTRAGFTLIEADAGCHRHHRHSGRGCYTRIGGCQGKGPAGQMCQQPSIKSALVFRYAPPTIGIPYPTTPDFDTFGGWQGTGSSLGITRGRHSSRRPSVEFLYEHSCRRHERGCVSGVLLSERPGRVHRCRPGGRRELTIRRKVCAFSTLTATATI